MARHTAIKNLISAANPPDETDGPPGAIAMASMLLSLGKKVTIITDRRAVNLNRDIINECVKKGIGDGGNELGMGKLKDKVKAFMTNGKLIACDVPADYAITAGVSNWGGYALTCGLYLLNSCPSHRRYLTRGLLQPINKEEQFQDWASNLPSVIKAG
ncbi:D-glutamate cyclase, mitochondrial [Takifugu flavidus]|uniref:D-glutamate cyclase, mitochondrial n=1 Tax=Takifugu flavidus TaxID=433684 RepID=A0A5C6NWD7_9TELE|nr:D-glutamate cyclase, mitochondrial [Takifugu flavidus]